MVVMRRHLRLALLVGLVWIVVESLLFYVTAQQIGFFPTLLLLTGKGVVGFFLLAANLRGVLGRIALNQWRNGLEQIGPAVFAVLGAFLIFLPGFLTTLAGLALFSPSLRGLVLRWARREKRHNPHHDVLTLDPEEWREMSSRKPRRRNAKTPTVAP